MGTSPALSRLAAALGFIRNIGLASWGFLVGCIYAGMIIALKG